MEFSLACVVFCLTTSCVLWKEATAVQCYKCTSCKEPFKASEATVVTCTYACLKEQVDSDYIKYVNRGCFTTAQNECAKNSYLGVDTNVCACTTDKCNGAESHSVQKVMLIVMSAFVFILRKKYF